MAASKPSASTKKKTTAKTTKAKTTKAAAAKPRKTVSKAVPAKKTTKRAKHAQSVRSFRLSSETESFISSRITLQTIYWSILSTVILVVGILILNAQLDILDTLNQISEGL